MSILVDQGTKLVVSGLTGREGSFHGMNNRAYGTELVLQQMDRKENSARAP